MSVIFFFNYNLIVKEEIIFYQSYYMKIHQLHHHNDYVHHIEVFSKYNSYFYIRKNQDFEDILQQLNKEIKKIN